MDEQLTIKEKITNEFFEKYGQDLTQKERDVFRLRFGLLDERWRTFEEIAQLFGVENSEVEEYLNNAVNKMGFFIEGYYRLVFCIFGSHDVPPIYYFNIIKLKELADEALNFLEENEIKMLKLRFGISVSKGYSLKQCGEELGVSAERARQIEGKALRRLRHPDRSRALREYVSSLATQVL